MQIWGESIPLCGGYCALIRSLVVRLVFLPLKESSHATFSRSASAECFSSHDGTRSNKRLYSLHYSSNTSRILLHFLLPSAYLQAL
ncbi:uncharacterized protein [Populus alba]|uniref:uncharacterized protein isoform X3 n=1 Tax=Populus alba TaxID=43335 RepID=UPI003CC6E038